MWNCDVVWCVILNILICEIDVQWFSSFGFSLHSLVHRLLLLMAFWRFCLIFSLVAAMGNRALLSANVAVLTVVFVPYVCARCCTGPRTLPCGTPVFLPFRLLPSRSMWKYRSVINDVNNSICCLKKHVAILQTRILLNARVIKEKNIFCDFLCLKYYRAPRYRMRCVRIVLVERRCTGCTNKWSSLSENDVYLQRLNGITIYVIFVYAMTLAGTKFWTC